MTINDLKNYYKSSYAFGKATHMSPTSYQNWCSWGFVPILSQIKIEQLTGGELRADLKHVKQVQKALYS